MRISAGIVKNRKLRVPNVPTVRPTKEVVRNAIFNIIGDQIKEFDVLDLFAGSGSLGIEALSLGAKHVDFVDKDRKCVKIIEENLENLNLTDRSEVFEITVDDVIDVKQSHKYELILADPPYEYRSYEKLLRICAELLVPTGLLFLEHKKDKEFVSVEGFEVVRSRKYGATYLTIFQKI